MCTATTLTCGSLSIDTFLMDKGLSASVFKIVRICPLFLTIVQHFYLKGIDIFLFRSSCNHFLSLRSSNFRIGNFDCSLNLEFTRKTIGGNILQTVLETSKPYKSETKWRSSWLMEPYGDFLFLYMLYIGVKSQTSSSFGSV